MAQNLHDFMKQMSAIVEGRTADLSKAGQKAVANIKKNEKEKKEAEKKDKPANVKESGAEFFRKYSDIVAEAESAAKPKPVVEGKKSMISEGIEDKLEAARAKAAKKGKIKEPEKAKVDPKRQVKGTRYGGSKQKDDEQIDEGWNDRHDDLYDKSPEELEDYFADRADMADMRRKEIRYKDGEEVAEDSSGREVNYKSLEIDGIDHSDYPDYVDAYISYGEWSDGTPMTDDELDQFQSENRELVGELILNHATDQMADAGDAARDRMMDEDAVEEAEHPYPFHAYGGGKKSKLCHKLRGQCEEYPNPAAAKAAWGKKPDVGNWAMESKGVKGTKQLDELSQKTYKNYIAKSEKDLADRDGKIVHSDEYLTGAEKLHKFKDKKRIQGQDRAAKKLNLEGKIDDLKDKQQAEKEADWWGEKTKKSEKKAPAKREVKGKAYGGAKQKDDDAE